jgi:hypothetical protein
MTMTHDFQRKYEDLLIEYNKIRYERDMLLQELRSNDSIVDIIKHVKIDDGLSYLYKYAEQLSINKAILKRCYDIVSSNMKKTPTKQQLDSILFYISSSIKNNDCLRILNVSRESIVDDYQEIHDILNSEKIKSRCKCGKIVIHKVSTDTMNVMCKKCKDENKDR